LYSIALIPLGFSKKPCFISVFIASDGEDTEMLHPGNSLLSTKST